MSETLRLELEPLGIDVLTILAAIVRTNFFSSLSSYTLPPHSLYASVAKEIQAVSRGEDTVKMKGVMGPEEFGRRVVKDVLGGSKGKTFTGTMGWAVEFMGFVPGWVWVSFTSLLFALEEEYGVIGK
jgi:1-acylglycerone phosphate reductase